MLSLCAALRIFAALAVVVLVLNAAPGVCGCHQRSVQPPDRRLDSVSSLGDFSTLLSTKPEEGSSSPDGNLARTVRIGDARMSVPSGVVLPRLADGYANTTIDGAEYRVRTFSVGAASIALGAPLAETQRRIAEL